MAYLDGVSFPPRIAFGAQRRPGWRTVVVGVSSGYEKRDGKWSRARHSFDISLAVRTTSDYQLVLDHFHMAQGRLHSFPFKDYVDFMVPAARGVLLLVGELPSTAFQLAKRYGSGQFRYDRIITRPQATPAIFRLRAGVTTNITASADLDLTTGGVDIDPAVLVAGDVLSWAGEFMVPCRYDTDDLPTAIVNAQPAADGELLVTCDSIPVVEVRERGLINALPESSSS